jgi:hypothetical protein
MWYGKKSIFDASEILDRHSPFWERFRHIFSGMVISFGEILGLADEEIKNRIEKIEKDTHGDSLPDFSHPTHEVVWFAEQVLGEEQAKWLLSDLVIGWIFIIVVKTEHLVANGEKPPYGRKGYLPSLEACERFSRVAPELEEMYYGKNPDAYGRAGKPGAS